MGLAFGVGAIARACSGLWQYLTERVRSRTELNLEHARNQATAQAIQLLPPGGELWETEPGGRTRIIRLPVDAGSSRPYPQLTESPDQ